MAKRSRLSQFARLYMEARTGAVNVCAEQCLEQPRHGPSASASAHMDDVQLRCLLDF
jgi:hypothetical protein